MNASICYTDEDLDEITIEAFILKNKNIRLRLRRKYRRFQ